jgi:hypothetical protein
MAFDLTDDEKAALIELLRGTVDRDRSLTSPRIREIAGNPREACAGAAGAAAPDGITGAAESEIAPWRGAREKAAVVKHGDHRNQFALKPKIVRYTNGQILRRIMNRCLCRKHITRLSVR